MYIRFFSLFVVASFGALVSALGTASNSRLHGAARSTTKTFLLEDLYQGEDFFSEWEFFTDADPTHGNVKYVSLQEAQAQSPKLAYVNGNTTVLAVDSTSQVAVGGQRKSVRIQSKKTYTGGLFIMDSTRMPLGCSTWPAFWTYGPNWPASGEIDIVEGVNNQKYDQMTLHTGSSCSVDPANGNSEGGDSDTSGSSAPSSAPHSSTPTTSSTSTTSSAPAINYTPYISVPPSSSTPGPKSCSVPGGKNQTSSGVSGKNSSANGFAFTGQVLHSDCKVAGGDNSGCGVTSKNPRSFGKGFNAAGGGVYALLWDAKGSIRIWFFDRSRIPDDITQKKPAPDNWGTPAAAWSSGTCDITSGFHDHHIVFDITLCGDWAGAGDSYSESGCPGTCGQMVANATNFADAKWEINYVAVYQ